MKRAVLADPMEDWPVRGTLLALGLVISWPAFAQGANAIKYESASASRASGKRYVVRKVRWNGSSHVMILGIGY
jgi:hypothetical protein